VQEYISVKVLPLEDLFSDSYRFRLPFFQRAYAWQTQEVGRLLSSVLDAMSAAKPRDYFLGKLMLAKKPADPDTALVDGHQRVMSLTILFAVLRDLEDDPAEKAWLNGFIRGADYRLAPQANLADFCLRHVQAPDATGSEPEEDMDELSETERNIIENRNHLRAELSDRDVTRDMRRSLARFLAARCCVIVSSVEDEDEAWRMLRIEEETRVEFNETNRAKASLLSIVPQSDRMECQRIWEECEALLGAADMYALLGHLRTTKLRRRSEKPVEIDIAEGFELNRPGAGKSFLRNAFLPAAERLAAIRRAQNVERPGRSPVDECLDRLSWINPQIWVPAALLWLGRGESDSRTILFFKRLERLIWMMRIAGQDPSKQQRRLLQLLAEIDRGVRPDDMRELDIGRAIRDAVLANLRSKTFDSKHYDTRVLRRISIALGQDPGPVHPERLTIEHILPRGWTQKSGWRTRFPKKKDVQAYAHKLGNLTFLTAAENRAADTLDWSEKRRIYARSRLVLSNRLGATVDWTPEAIMSRTEELIRILFDAWELRLQ
jgi:hypothetical protein